MPRQIDLFPQNLQVNNDPTNRLGVTSAQINKLNGEIPAKIAAAQAQAVTGFLTLLDQETGLDLLGLWNDYQSLVSFIEAGLTTSFNGIEAALQTLVSNASNAWTQIEDFLLTGDWADLSAAWTDIFGTAQEAEANWQTLFTELGFSVSTATQLADFLSGVSNTASNALTPSSSLNASNLWGLIPTQVVGSVASTAVVDVSPNPLLNPNFESAISVSPGSGWVWDSTVYFTPPSGDTAPGSAKVTADGVLHALRSNLIPVASGQHLAVSLPVLASGLVSAGTPLALHVITFNGNTQTGITTVTAIANPTGASTGWVNPPSGSKGGTLSGTYVVASGVTQVQLRLVVDTTATAGSVWFGNATASLSGGLIANLQSDLSTLQSDSAASTAAFSTFMSSIQSAITGYTSWSSFIAAMESAWITYSTTESGLLSSEVATLQQIINSLFGINTTTGLMAASNVSNVLGQGSLGDDVQAILDYIANALGHSGTGHTLTQIETYLGLIPAANLPTGVQSANTYWSTLMTNLFGASTPASTVQSTALPTAVQSANTYWSTLMTNLFGGSTPAATIKVGAVPTGVPATNIANVLGGANLGADVSSVQTQTNAQLDWWRRLSEDLWILADLFHVYYPLGSPSDTATTTSAGKRTYYSAQADIKLLFNQSQSVTPPALTVVDPGSQIQTNTAAATTAGTNASTALTNAAAAATTASGAASTAQGAIDATVQALTGSAATGAAPAAVKASQQAIPVANITPPPSPSATGIPIHGASGTGWGPGTVNPSGASSLTVTGSHTKATADNWIGFWVLHCVTGSGLSAPFTSNLNASYGSLSLPVLGQATVLVSSSTAWMLSYVGAFIPSSFNPPSAQTCTVQAVSGSGYLTYGVAAVSDSYSGVLSANVPASTSGLQGITGSNPAQAGVSSNSDDLMVQAFAAVALLANVSLSAYNKTSRANPSLNSMSGAGVALVAGEAAGNTSVSFSATMTSTSDYYAGVAVNLVGVGTDPIGSVFKVARTSTGVVNGASGANVFPTNFWPTTPTERTADFTWDATTGTLTCLNAGTYTFAVGVLEAAIGTPHYLRAAIFHNGAVEAQGTTCSVTTTATGLWAASVSDTFYCGVNDTIQVGAYLSTAVTSVFTGESTGSLTYFSAALANRGTIS